MDTFFTYKNISATPALEKLISVGAKSFPIADKVYKVFTYQVKVPKGKYEDDIYTLNPALLEILPRSCSILTLDGKIITALEGPTKFSGRTAIDEDPEDDNTDIKSTEGIFDSRKILDWASSKNLEIVDTVKENGKFAIMMLVEHGGTTFFFGGSKNYHILVDINAESISDSSDIINSIYADVKNNLVNLSKLADKFDEGYSLVGELCDGQHFTTGDNTVSWFGLFKSGNACETMTTLSYLREIGIKTVGYSLVYTPDSDPSEIENIYLASRCRNDEGSVLRFRNIKTGETILAKSKSVMYIVKRFMRQILLRGYKNIEDIKKRFVDASAYHGLSTDASIRITKILFSFGMWMMKRMYPVAVLGHMPVNSVRGCLPNGFNTYWLEYLVNGGTDIEVKVSDFGPFNASEYLAGVEIYKKRSYANPVKVIFIQGIQGSGKSTIGNYCVEKLASNGISAVYIEQDMYWGDTFSCQGALHHYIADANGPSVVLVTRCNTNPKQYSRYLDICFALPSLVSFASPANIDPLYLMISLAGIMNRSQTGDKLMVGRFDLPMLEVVKFTLANYLEYVKHPQSITYNTYNYDVDLGDEAHKIIKGDPKKIIEFVKEHYNTLINLRWPIEDVAAPIINLITSSISQEKIVKPTRIIYIGAAVLDDDKRALTEIVNANVSSGTIYIHHYTQTFVGGKSRSGEQPLAAGKSRSGEQPVAALAAGKPFTSTSDTIQPGQVIARQIDALVIRKSDGASAFRLLREPSDKGAPHITAKIPVGEKPAISGGFVGLTDDSVEIIKMDYPIELIGFWA